ncbi:hypothetical protein CYFUS_007585 [Cystobacter fuscus]|uniref:Uncharacterized protein n=1 Tax=Cystobacter fuscus TaxID=43 RepID=A0A250JEU7_9BACT|nr:hypothetical protein CYFUS_007585 [Cystobacter fuscus]
MNLYFSIPAVGEGYSSGVCFRERGLEGGAGRQASASPSWASHIPTSARVWWLNSQAAPGLLVAQACTASRAGPGRLAGSA